MRLYWSFISFLLSFLHISVILPKFKGVLSFFVSNSIIILLIVIFYFGSLLTPFFSISSFKFLGWLGIRFRFFFPKESSCTITRVTVSKVKTKLTSDFFQVVFYIFFLFNFTRITGLKG